MGANRITLPDVPLDAATMIATALARCTTAEDREVVKHAAEAAVARVLARQRRFLEADRPLHAIEAGFAACNVIAGEILSVLGAGEPSPFWPTQEQRAVFHNELAMARAAAAEQVRVELQGALSGRGR